MHDRTQSGLAVPTWPTARGGSDPKPSAQAGDLTFSHTSSDPLLVPLVAVDPEEIGHTHVALQIIVTHVWLDAHQVPQHPRHDVFPKDNNFLVEEPYPTRVRRQV